MRPYEHKVQYYETDKMGIVHHSNYIRWMEEARVDFLEQIGWGMDRLEALGMVSPVTAVECKYKVSTKFPERIRIEVGIEEFRGVKPETIESYGVVSEPVAEQMAEGVAKAQNAEVGVGVSGIAGPTGGTVTKPVGMVCFGFYVDGELTTVTKQFGDLGRNVVREAATEFVFEMLVELLQK